MVATGISTAQWGVVALHVALAVVIDVLGWRYLPQYSKRFQGLSWDTQRRLIIRLSTAPPKVFYLYVSFRLPFYSNEAIYLNQDDIQSWIRSTWLLGSFMYGYELIKTFPPTLNDIIHHAGWIALTYFAYSSPMATEGPTNIPMIWCMATCSFFSLGWNSVVLLGVFLLLNLGSWNRPRKWMCNTYSFLTWSMCISRPIEWMSYLAMMSQFWQIAHGAVSYLVLIATSLVLIGLCSLHRRWSHRSLKYSRDLWRNYRNATMTESGKDKAVTTFSERSDHAASKSKKLQFSLGSLLVDGHYWMVLGGLALPHLLKLSRCFQLKY
ncbi:hypothetical protein F5884DRAFT_390225 [Xylogone sp. PMI_703]|nr:hypothetical protein F5884DRAFT_390225 [Xylogone sp. PMI_703]